MPSPGRNANAELPAVDERLVVPESRFEIDDGTLVFVPPALEFHAGRHSKLATLLEVHAADDFNVAIGMLTRISHYSDRAPDASVYPNARDSQTGGRQLEHLAFELAGSASLGHVAKKAAGLAGRGVRRVFAIDIERDRAFEWSHVLGTWSILDVNSSITDLALAVPLPVRALLQPSSVDDAVARALLAKHNPVLEAALTESRSEGRAEGRAEGMVHAILAILTARAIPLQPAEQEQLLRERDPARLTRWSAGAATCASAAELLAIP